MVMPPCRSIHSPRAGSEQHCPSWICCSWSSFGQAAWLCCPALLLQARCVPGAGLEAECAPQPSCPPVLRVQHPWLLPKAMNKLLSGGQVERRHFATDLFPCELMKRYTQFQKKKKKIFYRPIILLSQYNATVEDLVSVNRRSNSDHQLSQISCTNTIATGLMPLPHKLTVPVQIITLPTMLFHVQKP